MLGRGMGRWLVDGMNVIGTRPTGWWRNRTKAMAGLVTDLQALAADTGDEVTVVFDGSPRELPLTDDVQVEFAPGGPNAADDAIVARLITDERPDEVQVVTSDRALSERVRERGGQVFPAKGFRKKLDALEI